MYLYNLYTHPYFFSYQVNTCAKLTEDASAFSVSASLFDFSKCANNYPNTQNLADPNYIEALTPDLLPMAVRYISYSPSSTTYLVERPPFQTQIDYSKNKSFSSRSTFKCIQGSKIWIPWTSMLITVPHKFERYSAINFVLYFNDGPLMSSEDVLINSFFPNSYSSSGQLCTGSQLSAHQVNKDNPDSIKQIANLIYNDYFSGGWNSDISNFLAFNKAMLPALEKISKDNKKYFTLTLSDIYQELLDSSDPLYTRRHISEDYKDFLYCYSHMTLEEVINYFSILKSNVLNTETNLFRSSNFTFVKDIIKSFSNIKNDFTPRLTDSLRNLSTILNPYMDSSYVKSVNTTITLSDIDIFSCDFLDIVAHSEIITDHFIYLYDNFVDPFLILDPLRISNYRIFSPYTKEFLNVKEKENV